MTTQPGLLCPVCRIDLVMTERQNVEIDYCPKCRGVWLDRGELDKIIDKSLAAESLPVTVDRGHGASSHSDHHGSSHGRHGGHGRGLLGRLFD